MSDLSAAVEAARHAVGLNLHDATRAITAAAPLIEASVRAKIAEEAAETFDEWRVTGQPAVGYLGYDFTWSPDHNPHLGDPERAARSFVAAIAKEGGWENGPHLTRRTITRTDWEPVGAEHAVRMPGEATERPNTPDAYPSEGATVSDAQKPCGCVGKCPSLFVPCPVCGSEVRAVGVDNTLATTYHPCKHVVPDEETP